MLTRKEAIADIRLGRGIQMVHVGRFTTYVVILRRNPVRGGVEAVIDCSVMRRSYYLRLTAKQTLAYIRRFYPRKEGDMCGMVNGFDFPENYQEVA